MNKKSLACILFLETLLIPQVTYACYLQDIHFSEVGISYLPIIIIANIILGTIIAIKNKRTGLLIASATLIFCFLVFGYLFFISNPLVSQKIVCVQSADGGM